MATKLHQSSEEIIKRLKVVKGNSKEDALSNKEFSDHMKIVKKEVKYKLKKSEQKAWKTILT